MDIKLSFILKGWANLFKDKFDKLDPEIKRLSTKRLKLCDKCHMRTGHACDPLKSGTHVTTGQIVNGCGCHIAAKSMVPEARCPLGKW